TMTAVEISTPGGPEVLRLAQRPTPKPGPGEVLIRVFAAGVNRPDVMQRQGHYPPPPGASDIPGLEVAGPLHSRKPGSCCPRTGSSGLERRFLALEQNEIGKYAVTEDALGSRLHVRPLYPLFPSAGSAGCLFLQRQNGQHKFLPLAPGQCLDLLE